MTTEEKLENIERYFESIRKCIERGDAISTEFKRSITNDAASTLTFEINGGA